MARKKLNLQQLKYEELSVKEQEAAKGGYFTTFIDRKISLGPGKGKFIGEEPVDIRTPTPIIYPSEG